MNAEEIKFVKELVGKTIGIPSEEAASLLFDTKEDGSGEVKPDALKILIDKDAARVQTFKDRETQAHDKGYKKAQAEALTKFEKDLKEKYGVTSDKQGVELIEHVVTEKMKSQGGELDEEKIKRSPTYQTMMTKLTKEKEEAVKAETDKYTQLQTSIQKESTFKTVSEKATDFIKKLKPILPEGKTPDGKSKADIQIQKLLNELSSEYEFQVKDGVISILKDGKLVEDNHGHMVKFEDLVKQRAETYWDFQAGEGRSGSGNNNDDDTDGSKGGNKGYTGPIPKSEDEYLKLISEAKDDKAKIELTKVWTETKPK